MRVVEDRSHSTDALTIDGSVWEVVFQTDENYWHVAMLTDRSVAELLAEQGNAFVEADSVIGFEVREHKLVTALHREWTRQDFRDEMDGWDFGDDYFLPEDDDEDER